MCNPDTLRQGLDIVNEVDLKEKQCYVFDGIMKRYTLWTPFKWTSYQCSNCILIFHVILTGRHPARVYGCIRKTQDYTEPKIP